MAPSFSLSWPPRKPCNATELMDLSVFLGDKARRWQELEARRNGKDEEWEFTRNLEMEAEIQRDLKMKSPAALKAKAKAYHCDQDAYRSRAKASRGPVGMDMVRQIGSGGATGVEKRAMMDGRGDRSSGGGGAMGKILRRTSSLPLLDTSHSPSSFTAISGTTSERAPCSRCIARGLRCTYTNGGRSKACRECVLKKVKCGDGPGQRPRTKQRTGDRSDNDNNHDDGNDGEENRNTCPSSSKRVRLEDYAYPSPPKRIHFEDDVGCDRDHVHTMAVMSTKVTRLQQELGKVTQTVQNLKDKHELIGTVLLA
ncbi:hypothetical protein NM688_g8227 [Phlebia brevispora]|uniref:Uncharacterized protein n=1 Tax=Phlebia brevispora TaxID=194682 RepID=A0ACC1RVN2_9APHY|nr:hypothetical protein NM688_g8227 [Phlebia brevispora]